MGLEIEESVLEKEKLADKKSSTSKEEEREQSKSKGKKRILTKDKILGTLGAAILLSIGGPVGIALGIGLLALVFRKPLIKAVKKIGGLMKKGIKKLYKTIKKRREKKKIKKEQANNVELTGYNMELTKGTLKKMPTRDNSVSKINVLPDHQAKSTSNGKFNALTSPSIKLSEKALKRRGSLSSLGNRKKSASLTRRNSLPNLKVPSFK